MERWAISSGNWVAARFNGGTLPEAGDTVHANGFAVTVDVDITAEALSTRAGATAVAGGSFTTSGQRIINADVYSGSSVCLSLVSLSRSVLFGDSHGGLGSNQYGVWVAALCEHIGDSYGGEGTNSSGSQVQHRGIQRGNATGGSAANAHGSNVQFGGVLFGNTFGSPTHSAWGVTLLGGHHIGDSNGGGVSGAYGTNVDQGSIHMGSATGGSVAGAHGTVLGSGSTGIIDHASGDVDEAFGVYTVNTQALVVIHTEAGFAKEYPATTITDYERIPFAVDRYGPVPADVRSGIQYGTLDEFTGTLVVPSAKYPPTLIRTLSDTNPIQFAWPTASVAGIVVERSINGGAYEAANGVATFHRSENEVHWYLLSYAAEDRAEGSVRYRLTKDATVRYFTLAVITVAAATGTGAKRIPISATDGGVGVGGVRVRVVGSTESAETGTLGTAFLDVDGDDPPIEYTLRTTVPIGYAPVADITREVALVGDPDPVVIALVATTYESADAPQINVVLPVIDQAGDRLPNTSVLIEFLRYLEGATRTAVVVYPPLRKKSDALGEVEVRLLRLASYRASYTVPGGYVKTVEFETPDLGVLVVVEPE